VRVEAEQIYKEICEALKGRAICRFAYTIRTFAEQAALYAQGRTKPGPVVTDAAEGLSFHNYGLAIDVVFLLDKDNNGTHESASWDFKTDFDGDNKADWAEVDAIFTKYGWLGLKNKRGERWDLPHFQKTFGLSVTELKSRFIAKQVDKNNYVKI
jgi:peptidoglycan LD-endopeptidase CwlK